MSIKIEYIYKESITAIAEVYFVSYVNNSIKEKNTGLFNINML